MEVDGNYSTHATSLASLSPDVIGAICKHLSVEDIHSCLLCSRVLYNAVHDERVWQAMCQEAWAGYTDLHRWLVSPLPLPSPIRQRGVQPPSTYRALYYLLLRSAPIVGLWRLVGEGPAGALIAFNWTKDSIKGQELQYDSLGEEIELQSYYTICPGAGRLGVRVEVVGEDHAVVKDVGGSQRSLHRSPSAEAAASVALSQASGGADVLGTSPQGSFEFEWLQFMAAKVSSGRAKQKRRAAKSPGGPGGSPGATVHHLKRVQPPLPSSKHPLAGMWAAECGGGRIEILRVVYDFSGASARIIATKVTGNRDVPAGQQAWMATAAPVPTPWPQLDREQVSAYEARWQEEERARNELQEWLLDEEEDEGGEGLLGNGASAGGGWWGGQQGPQVVAVHEASMQLAAPAQQGGRGRWADARLWVLSGGQGLALLVGDDLFGMKRIDADLAAILPPRQQMQQAQQQLPQHGSRRSPPRQRHSS